MDEIDITSAEFSLHSLVPLVNEIPSVNEIIDITSHGEYKIYIYIGILLLIGILGFLGYKYYENTKRKRVTFQDKIDECYGGVCQRV